MQPLTKAAAVIFAATSRCWNDLSDSVPLGSCVSHSAAGEPSGREYRLSTVSARGEWRAGRCYSRPSNPHRRSSWTLSRMNNYIVAFLPRVVAPLHGGMRQSGHKQEDTRHAHPSFSLYYKNETGLDCRYQRLPNASGKACLRGERPRTTERSSPWQCLAPLLIMFRSRCSLVVESRRRVH